MNPQKAYWPDQLMAFGYAMRRATRTGIRHQVRRCTRSGLWMVQEVGA